MSDDLLVERDGAVATVVLNRPGSHNAITLEMYKAIPTLFATLDSDESVKVVVLRGAGTKAFASGADISEFEEVRGNAAGAKSYNQCVAAAEHAVENMAKPTIALIHGYCIGGGCGLALSADLRFGDDRTRIAITPAKLGLVYSLESTKRLVDLVGPARTKWILMSGQQIGAEQAHRLGLLDELASVEDVKKDSGISTWQQWVDKAKRQGSVTIAGIGEVNVDFIVSDILAEKAGFTMEYVPFDDQGELITALTSDAVDGAVSNPSEVIGQLDSGDLVALMFTGKEVLPKYPEVPTAESLGYPGLPTMPRGLILPPDAPKEATDWWIETMKKVAETPDWKAYVEDSFLTEDLRWGADFTTFLDETNSTFETILRERGKIPGR